MEGKEDEEKEGKATWTARYINDLPDSSFLYIESGKDKDEDGKTTPRSARHFPYRDSNGDIDLPHLRNAIARIPQSNAPGLDDAKKNSLQERARRMLDQAQGKAADWPEFIIVDGVMYVKEITTLMSEEKVGRVLAARNARRLEAALATITEVLKDAGLIEEPEEEDAEEKGAEDVPAETDQDAPPEGAADDAPAEPEAGPEAPPTSERMALLRKLQVELLEVDKQ